MVQPRMRIAFVTPELAPWAKVGGLGDISQSLPPALAASGHDVRVFLPYYGRIDGDTIDAIPVSGVQQVGISLAGRFDSFNLFESQNAGLGKAKLYLIQCAPFFERDDQVYTLHDDEYLRWMFFSRAVFECCQRLGWGPSIFHLNDWPTALVPLLLKTTYAWDQLFADSRTVFTIHNLGYHGTFGAHTLADMGLSEQAEWFSPAHLREGYINFLETGLRLADRLTTVSPTYAREIQTPEQGHGLDGLLRERADDLTGILNGIDEEVWHPSRDRAIPLRFGSQSLWRRDRCKKELLRRLGLPADSQAPVLGLIARLATQKGIDLLQEVLPELLDSRSARMVVLGSGEAVYEEFFADLQERFPTRVAFRLGYDEPLSHHIEAGVDLFLMPSRYEPCGLNQMYSQRYGAIPLVHRTGGLADTVVPFTENPDAGTGFVFEPYHPGALRAALDQALDLYDQPDRWQALQRRAMEIEWSWGTRAEQYVQLYRSLQPAV